MPIEAASIETAPTRTIDVSLGTRSYPILIGRGLLADAGERVRDLGAQRACIVTDANVAAQYLAPLRGAIERAGLVVSEVVVAPGEGSKNFATLEKVSDALLAARIERGDIVIALGGGVVGDLAGFAAAILRRGVRLVQIPTSLLAQVDSSVGGKTGINTGRGKNLIGAFHQPSLVLADTGTLETLPVREFRAGYAEVAKYGLLGDARFFAWLEDNLAEVMAAGPALTEAIAVSCASKAAIVARDEFETGDRALLNLGHTFGHALETAVGYDSARLVHGEGVAIGTALAFRFSAALGLAPMEAAERVERHLKAAGLPIRIADIPGELPDAERLLDLMRQDKKVRAGQLTFILVHGIGKAFVARDVSADDALSFLKAAV